MTISADTKARIWADAYNAYMADRFHERPPTPQEAAEQADWVIDQVEERFNQDQQEAKE